MNKRAMADRQGIFAKYDERKSRKTLRQLETRRIALFGLAGIKNKLLLRI